MGAERITGTSRHSTGEVRRPLVVPLILLTLVCWAWIYCLGCCWALMLLLFVGGVMNLAVIAALTLVVAFEKISPFGVAGARISGVLLMVAAVWMLVRS